MPKRECPFNYDLEPQMKMHISQKDYEKDNQSAMNKIYDKTKEKLFQGATNAAKNTFNFTTLSFNNPNNDFCKTCTETNVVVCKCHFCEKSLCQPCSIFCRCCKEQFCKSCSMMLYDNNNGDDGICFTCAS